MPLVLICGQPCSGKSAVAAQLVQVLQARGISTCNLIDEPSLHLLRNTSYKGEHLGTLKRLQPPIHAQHTKVDHHSLFDLLFTLADVPSEKNTRALLKSTVERYIGRKDVTILDSINNIKV